MGNRSLDDFLGDDGAGEEGESDGADDRTDDETSAESARDSDTGEASDASDASDTSDTTDTGETADDEEDSRVDPEAVEPAETTYAWSPAGGVCAACGASVERRWRGEAGLVCGDCKEW